MTFLQNAWYMIGWAEELPTGAFVHRTIADHPVLVYRLQDGTPAAIRDRCPHRFVPLHMGKQVGDTIQCGYHGLCFDKTGACVKNPVDGAIIPRAAKVRPYAVVERDGVLWVWLGDAASADLGKLPDYRFLSLPGRAVVRGYTHTRAHYQLAIDNLADLTHIQFVHTEFQASEVFAQLSSEVSEDGDAITSHLVFPNGRPPAAFTSAVAGRMDTIDLVYEVRWTPASNARLRARGYAPGDRATPLFDTQSAHIVTPETAGTYHYFYANARDYALDDPATDERIRLWQRVGFAEQDRPMLEAQQQCVGEQDLMDLGPVLLRTDAAAVRIRRTLKALIEKENTP